MYKFFANILIFLDKSKILYNFVKNKYLVMNDINIMTTDKDGNLADYINPILDLKSLSRNQVKNLAKEIANGESITHS